MMVAGAHGLARAACALAFAVVVATGCGGEGEDGVACEAAFETCDLSELACLSNLADGIACMTGHDPGVPVVQSWEPDEAVEFFTPEAPTAEEMRLVQQQLDALALFRLVPEQYSAELATEAYVDSVPAFYDVMQGRIIVVEIEPRTTAAEDDAGGPGGGSPDAGLAGDEQAFKTYVHELIHAARDQRTGLAAFYGRTGSIDAWLAARAVVEGEAQLFAQLAWLEATGQDPAEMDWEALLENYRMAMVATYVAVDAPYSLADRYLPYPYGYAYVVEAWQRGGNAAIEALYANPPVSTRAITAGFGAELSGSGAPALVASDEASPMLAQRFAPVAVLRLGAWLIDASVQRFREAPRVDLSWSVLQDLEGDILSLYHDADTDSPVAIWRLRFADAASAQAMEELTADWPPEIQRHVAGSDMILLGARPGGPTLDAATLEWQALTPIPRASDAVTSLVLAASPPR